MQIRPYKPTDAQALTNLFMRSVEAIGPRHYSAAQVAAWAARAPSPDRLAALLADGRLRLVAADAQNRPLAFADLERDGHVAFLYCAQEAAGQGVTAALYTALEQRARSAGIARLFAEASEAARRFFVKQGFTVTAERRFEISGVPIHNHAVEKLLASPALAGSLLAREIAP